MRLFSRIRASYVNSKFNCSDQYITRVWFLCTMSHYCSCRMEIYTHEQQIISTISSQLAQFSVQFNSVEPTDVLAADYSLGTVWFRWQRGVTALGTVWFRWQRGVTAALGTVWFRRQRGVTASIGTVWFRWQRGVTALGTASYLLIRKFWKAVSNRNSENMVCYDRHMWSVMIGIWLKVCCWKKETPWHVCFPWNLFCEVEVTDTLCVVSLFNKARRKLLVRYI